jgi:hypothetical protein
MSCSMREIDCALSDLKNASPILIRIFLLQYTQLFSESGSGKRFQGSIIYTIDSSHRKTGTRTNFAKFFAGQNFPDITQKSTFLPPYKKGSCLIFGSKI